jgi:dTDP-4-amino-4,6-dideoxygalactose transaminase
MTHVLAEGRFILGPEVEALEKELARWSGAAAVVGVASGTDALKIALMLRGVGPGDAVFVPAFTFVATAEAAVAVGATPVCVDIKADDMTMDVVDLRERLLSIRRDTDLRPAAVIPVDIFGVPADYDAITSLAAEFGLCVIADAAQSFGAALDKRRAGTLAPVTTLSFYPTKPLGCFGDGGAVLTTQPEDEAVLRELRQHGFDRTRRVSRRIGLNSRLDSLQAAVLLARMELFEDELASRERIARHYTTRLETSVDLPESADEKRSAWAVYTIRSPKRDRIRARLQERGIATAVFYDRPVCDQPAYNCYREFAGALRVSRQVCDTVVSLPMHPYLHDDEVDHIADEVIAAI